MDAPRYQPFYCEENVWWLAQDDERFGSRRRWAVFISNAERQCALWQQRAAAPGAPVVWDYHVILVVEREGGLEVWDLDSRLGAPVPLAVYLAGTFPLLPPEASRYAPRFRVVPAEQLVARFCSDRSHMRDAAGGYVQPPPAWDAPAAPGQASNLMRFVDMADDVAGVVVELAELPPVFQVDT